MQVINSDDLCLYIIYAPFLFYNNDTDVTVISPQIQPFLSSGIYRTSVTTGHNEIPETQEAFRERQILFSLNNLSPINCKKKKPLF